MARHKNISADIIEHVLAISNYCKGFKNCSLCPFCLKTENEENDRCFLAEYGPSEYMSFIKVNESFALTNESSKDNEEYWNRRTHGKTFS